jgi:PAS domain S-box-containing protein
MLGYEEEELLALPPGEFPFIQEGPSPREAVEAAIAKGINNYTVQRRYFGKDGRIILGESNVVVVNDSDGKPAFVIVFITDLTELKANEERLVEYAVRLEDSNKELEEFVYAASHDLREPLRTITSYVQLMSRRYNDKFDEEGHTFMQFIVKGAQRMNNLILALLHYSRVGRDDAEREQIDLNRQLDIVRENLFLLIEESSAQITSDPLPSLPGVEAQIQTVLQNLVSNAIKYRSEAAPLVHVSAEYASNGKWTIGVHDNGIGIDPEYHEKIFALFRRLHNNEQYEGTGIGLAMCKKIIATHGGQLWVASTPGKGSSFYFSLPG